VDDFRGLVQRGGQCCPFFRKCDDYREPAEVSSRGAQGLRQALGRKLTSYSNFHHPRLALSRRLFDINGQTSFNGLIQILEEFLEILALRRATRNRRNLGPISAFFRLVNHYLNLQLFTSGRTLVPSNSAIVSEIIPRRPFQKRPQLSRTRRMAQLTQSFCFNLTNALAGDSE